MKRFKFARGDESVAIPLLRPLFDDVVECEELLDRSDTQFARRALVRAVFAFNEGYLYWLKGVVFQLLLDKSMRSDKTEIAKLLLLWDYTYTPDSVGKIKPVPNRIPFKNHCAFVLRTAAECADFDPSPLFSDNGWEEMQAASHVRDRITHPKKPEDLQITDKELHTISEGSRWLFNSHIDIINSFPQATDEATEV